MFQKIRSLKNVKVRLLINGAVIFLSLLCVLLTAILGWNAWHKRAVAVRLSAMNEMADKIIIAAAQEALERGMTATALGSDEPLSPDLSDKMGGVPGERG